MIKALFIGFVIGLLLFVTLGHTAEITFENCQPGTWIGGVRWLDNKTNYEDVPELEFKSVGSLVVDLEPGLYAITHYRPPYFVLDFDGDKFWLPAAFLEFKEITVTVPATHSFGCEE